MIGYKLLILMKNELPSSSVEKLSSGVVPTRIMVDGKKDASCISEFVITGITSVWGISTSKSVKSFSPKVASLG